ncbi:ankyrin repeat domain-containing protein [Gemmatimonas sp.]|uniref:ankyrin repeat domain-containing protein n=1 Tax=Gemmatimonas sp. TaxID=1962908 RepID=UPI0027BAED90|nr:ankyrin repeat domain-containing protein [Gemmatimonas sp.]
MSGIISDASHDEFLVASAVPVAGSHRAGTLDDARGMLQADVTLVDRSIYAAAVCGNAVGVQRWLARNPALATTPGGPNDWDALTWCCFSRWLRDEPVRSADFVTVARALINAGASVNTGFTDEQHGPNTQFESALYGAAGVAFCAPLTALLLHHGADPNDEEVPYHAAEHYAHDVVTELLRAPVPLTRDSLATLLLRKCDWHDLQGVEQLLRHGADPNHPGRWPFTPLMQALRRDNDLAIIEALLDAGADAARTLNGASATSLAAWHGRTDALQVFAERGVELPHEGLDAVAVDVTLGDTMGVRARLFADQDLRDTFMWRLPEFLCRCAGNGSLAPLSVLLQLAPSPEVRWTEGDGYWHIPPNSTALDVAVLRRQTAAERLIREFAAGVD